jgi:lipopolysaccharide assembly outer membrane protein LptD (OstA)
MAPIDTATRLINTYGKSLLLVKAADAGSFDPDTGTETADADAVSIKGVLNSVNPMLVDGTQVEADDDQVMVNGNVDVEVGDFIVIGTDAATDRRGQVVAIDDIYYQDDSAAKIARVR